MVNKGNRLSVLPFLEMDGNFTPWLEFPKFSEEYMNGVRAFVNNAFAKYADGDQLKCPCRLCYNRKWGS